MNTNETKKEEVQNEYVDFAITYRKQQSIVPKNTKFLFGHIAKLKRANKGCNCGYSTCEEKIHTGEMYVQLGHTQIPARLHISCANKTLEELQKKIDEDGFIEIKIQDIGKIISLKELFENNPGIIVDSANLPAIPVEGGN